MLKHYNRLIIILYMGDSVIESLERQEIIDKLINSGYGKLVEMLLNGDGKVFTRKGRLNKSGACRALGWKAKQLEDALEGCKEILGPDFEI